MSKANKSMFAELVQTKDMSYDLGNGETLELTINSLKLGDIVAIEELEGTKDKFQIILRSLTGDIPDLTIDDVMNIPMIVVEDMINDICEFNGIDISDVGDKEGN